jgi:hypothetical protein
LDKPFALFEPQFPYLGNRNSDFIYFLGKQDRKSNSHNSWHTVSSQKMMVAASVDIFCNKNHGSKKVINKKN